MVPPLLSASPRSKASQPPGPPRTGRRGRTNAGCLAGRRPLFAARPPNGDEILQRLGHLQTLDAQVPGVQEVVDPLLAAAGAGVEVRLGLRARGGGSGETRVWVGLRGCSGGGMFSSVAQGGPEESPRRDLQSAAGRPAGNAELQAAQAGTSRASRGLPPRERPAGALALRRAGCRNPHLRQLVVVVGEAQVLAASVDVHLAAQDGRRHGAALNVPACAARKGPAQRRTAWEAGTERHQSGRSTWCCQPSSPYG